MAKKQKNTEDRIILAARKVFIAKGMDGARMQEIADEAQINKALLHYYFRSKGKLFDRVFTETIGELIELLNEVFLTTNEFSQFINHFVRAYINLIQKKPFIANFVLHELNRNPSRIVELIGTSGLDKTKIVTMISRETRPLSRVVKDPVHLIVDILSLCIFPFVARPIIQGVFFDDDHQAYDGFISQRADHIIELVNHIVFENPSI